MIIWSKYIKNVEDIVFDMHLKDSRILNRWKINTLMLFLFDFLNKYLIWNYKICVFWNSSEVFE